jgi:cytochrome c
MNAIEFNKIAGAVLFALLAMFGARTVSNIIFHPVAPEKPGYIIEVNEDDGTSIGVAVNDGTPQPTLAQNLSIANTDKGQRAAKKCASCHTFDSGGPSKSGPNLYGIVGRKAGAVSGYAYSSALVEKGQWGFAELDAFIANPKAYVPGTKMAFAGIKSPTQRADLILYLRNLSSSPLPLPTPEPIEAAPEKAADADSGAKPDAAAEPEAAAKPDAAPDPASDATAPAAPDTGSQGQPAPSDPDTTGSIEPVEPSQPASLPLPERNTKRERPQESAEAQTR